MAKKKNDESNGEKTATEPVGVESIREQVKQLPPGTKERVAWEELGEGKISREEFRDIWLQERVSAKKKPEATS